MFGDLKKNNQSIIFCFKVMTEVFQHFTWSSCSSCGISLTFVSLLLVHIFLAPSSVYLKWYWTLVGPVQSFLCSWEM